MTEMENLIPPPAPLEPNNPPVNPRPKSQVHKYGILGGILVLLLAGAALGFWQYKSAEKQNAEKNKLSTGLDTTIKVIHNPYQNQPSTTPENQTTTTTPDTTTTTPDNGLSEINTYDAFKSPECKNRLEVLRSKSGIIQWQSPEKISDLLIFSTGSGLEGTTGETSYMLGHFTQGTYQGGDLILTIAGYDPMGPGFTYHIVRQGEKFTILGKYSSDALPDVPVVKKNVNLLRDEIFDISDLDFPGSLTASNGAKLARSAESGFFNRGLEIFCADNLIKVFVDSDAGDVYTDASSQPNGYGANAYFPKFGFYVKAADGSLVTYQLDVNFMGSDHIPLIIYSNGKKNTQEYSYQHLGGCGASQYLDVADVKLSDLIKIGETFNGQIIYTYKDSKAEDLQSTYDNLYVPEGQKKPSYSVFLTDYPIFFWQDPFGRFARFKNMRYQPMAECGKPVIYLYPEQTEKVSVKLNPAGGFTYSEPDYGSGWNVIADPKSNITNLADGKNYPYLFWEGRGGIYRTPDRGFVVEQKDIHIFLTDKLQQLGLNNKESADFMEFWEPKMQGSPYYFVTFMGNTVMDELAPLSITPKPDTVIRVLMDFTPLDHKIWVEGFNIRTPERKGFTVVEWGGVLRNDKIDKN